MLTANRKRFVFALLGLLVCLAWQLTASSVSAQVPKFKSSGKFGSKRGPLSSQIGSVASSVGNPVTASSTFTVHKESRTGVLEVKAEVSKTRHIYSTNKLPRGAIGKPTVIKLAEDADCEIAGKFVPDHKPHISRNGAEEFEGTVVWKAPIKFAKDFDWSTLSIPVKFSYIACDALGCLPPRTDRLASSFEGFSETAPEITSVKSGSLTSKGEGAKELPSEVAGQIMQNVDTPESLVEMAALYDADSKINYTTLGEKVQTTLITALLGAFVGGFLLNLMPCVFPVLGIKVMGFVEQAGSEPKKIRLHGLAFTAGLVVSMWALAGFILILKFSFGQEVSWGQQMGNSYFVVCMIILLFLLGLNMAGVFEIGTSMTRLGGKLEGKKGYSSSFFSGILTTLIATPCSGPFLGAAMGYTLAQPPAIAMFLFTIFALGIALPYLVLSMFPVLINSLPRPGAWMETFKVTMAFALFATVAFFMQTFGGQTGVDGLAWLAMALVVIGLAAYFYGHWSAPHFPARTRYVWGMLLPLCIVSAGGWMAWDAAGEKNVAVNEDGWRSWNPGIVELQTRKKNRIVFVDYTADW